MSRTGYDEYSVGPFDAFYSRRKRRKEALENYDSPSSAMVDRSAVSLVSKNNVDRKLLTSQLQRLTQELYTYETQLAEAYKATHEKKKLIEKHENSIKNLQEVIIEIDEYRRSQENQVSLIQEKIAQVQLTLSKQTDDKQQQKIFSSDSRERVKSIASVLPADYMPQPGAIEALTQFHQIPIDFIRKKLIEFRIHYIDTGEKKTGWDRSFYNWVVNGWKRERHNTTIDESFQPSEELLKKLSGEGITSHFCETERKHFILYWQEQNATFTPKLWQERFNQWIQRAWRRHKSDEGRAQASRPTTAEFRDAKFKDPIIFNFDDYE